MNMNELIAEVTALPVEERAILVDSLLLSFEPPESATERKWAATAKRRLDELRSGQVQAVPGEQVFNRISKKSPA